jgi:hypothetical protein
MCVQRFDGSLSSAIHITYRISLRSSSMPEPRDPLLKVLTIVCGAQTTQMTGFGQPSASARGPRAARQSNTVAVGTGWEVGLRGRALGNDPSAGSPTETLLRLLLPLNDQVWITSRLGVGVATLPKAVREPH